MNIYQSNTYRKDLYWLHFDNEPRAQDSQQVKDQQSHISAVCSLSKNQVAARSTSPETTTMFHAWLYSRFIETQSNLRKKKLHRMNQLPWRHLKLRDNIKAIIEFRRQSQTQYLKR